MIFNLKIAAASIDGDRAIRNAFSSSREQGRRSLVGYLTAGDPAHIHTPKLCRALIDGGIDILELGIPCSDPIADGPTIQAASARSIAAGTTPEDCFNIARTVKDGCEGKRDVPIVLLTYYNSIFRFGTERFLARASACGIDGIVVPDLPQIQSQEFTNYKQLANAKGLSTILLATPTTSEARLRMIMKETSGFLYVVSLMGVTGVRTGESEINSKFVRRVCEFARRHDKRESIPVAVGFGISKPAHVQSVVKAGADGVIVGSAFVNIVSQNLGDVESASRDLERFTRKLCIATYDSAR